MADAEFEDFFGGAGGGGTGLYPVFPPKRPLANRSGGSPDGFNADGDYIQLPASLGLATLVYRDNANAIVWSITPTDINANCTDWMTFNLDSVDNLLWLLAMDTANDVIYTATIDAAGTITNVGNTAVATNLTQNPYGWISSTSNGRRGASMRRAVQGVGNFTVVSNFVEFVIDSSNGSLVSETTLLAVIPGSFPSSDGIYFTPASVDNLSAASNIKGTQQQLLIRNPSAVDPTQFKQSTLLAPLWLGLPNSQNLNNQPDNYSQLQWRGEVLIVNPGTTLGNTTVVFDPDEYLAAIDALVKNFRLNQ